MSCLSRLSHYPTSRGLAGETQSRVTLSKRHRRLGIQRRYMWALSALASFALVAVAVSGCGSSSTPAASSTPSSAKKSSLFNMLPASVRSSDTLIDYEQPSFPPMETTSANGSGLSGVDISLAKAAASVIGVHLKFVSVANFAELFPALTTGRADLVWSGIFDAPSRRTDFTFADYFRTGTQLYIPTSEAKTYTSVSKLCGHTIAGETATLYQHNLTAVFSKICAGKAGLSFVNLSGIAQQNLTIKEGRAVAAVAGPESVDNLQRTQPGQWQRLGPTYAPTDYGVMFANNAFGKQVEKVIVLAINRLISNGTYTKILRQYGAQQQALTHATVDKAPPLPS
jgi:polar amino acid transport system substrate-binding protein